MSFFELASKRYSERFFDSRKIEKEKLDKILEAGRLVPTACNYQPQKIYIIKTESSKELLKEVMPNSYNAPLVLLVCYDINIVWKNPKDSYFKDYNSGEQDASICATTMMYQAEELGIHTIWLRGFDSKKVADIFKLDKNCIPVMMLGLGYPREDSRPNEWHFKRKSIDELVVEL